MQQTTTQHNGKPTIVAFVCNWCTYAGADLAGSSRLQYPANVRLIRVPCSGRIDPLFVLKAFAHGADAVLVSGCHPGDCHYSEGNYYARRRMTILRKLLDLVGLERQRLRWEWVSAAEGKEFAQVIREMVADLDQLPAAAASRPSASPATPRLGLAAPPGATAPMPTTANDAITERIRQEARRLLESGEVRSVIGYAPHPRSGFPVPFFARSPEDADRLVYNEFCHHNLAVFLNGSTKAQDGKVAVVAKGCDARALIGLMQEKQINRDDVVILGVPCGGVVDVQRLRDGEEHEMAQLSSVRVDGTDLLILLDGQEIRMTRAQALDERCLTCRAPTPIIADVLAAEPIPAPKLTPEERHAYLAEVEALPPEERRAFFQDMFSRCIRCYACRNACPLCFCDVCFVDQTRPQWVPRSSHRRENELFHLTRAMHLAGRCVECGACETACPMGIPLGILSAFLAREVEREFGHVSGMDPEEKPALSKFKPEDREDMRGRLT